MFHSSLKYVFLSMSLLSSFISHADENTSNHENNMHLYSGKLIELIDIAFEDYLNVLDNPFKEFRKKKFYNFVVIYGDDITVIKIQYNQKSLKEATGMSFKGGGGEYKLDMKTFAIISKSLYK